MTDSDFVIEIDEKDHEQDIESLPLWFQQIMELNNEARKARYLKAMALIKKSKPETYLFINKFKCQIIGFCPRVEYTLGDGNSQELDVIWRHPFGIDTLMFWCPAGEFVFQVNANLKYNESVLNKVIGNNIPPLRGLTG